MQAQTMKTVKAAIRFILIVISISFYNVTYCQQNFLDGYIIDLEGDTVKGLIDFRNWDKSPGMVTFVNKTSMEAVRYKPLSIYGFGVNNEHYLGTVIETEVSPFMLDDLQYGSELRIKNDTAFLLNLIQGEKCLFFYKNPLGKEMFYVRQGMEIQLLVQKKYLADDENGKTVWRENRQFIGQLSLYLRDCPKITSKLGSTNYNYRSLKSLFQYYDQCANSKIVSEKKYVKFTTGAGILAGIAGTSLDFRGEAPGYLVDADFSKSVNFSGGAFFEITMARNMAKWSIVNEIVYTNFKTSGNYEQVESADKFQKTSSTIGFSYLKLNTIARFNYPAGRFSVFANIGMSNGYSLSNVNHRQVEVQFYSTHRTYNYPVLEYYRKYEQGLLAGFGGRYGKFSLEARYERGNGMSEYINLNSLTERVYLLAGYAF